MKEEKIMQGLSLFKEGYGEQKMISKKKISSLNSSDFDEYRRHLLKEYRKNHKGILQKVKQGQASTTDELMNLIIQDLLQQSQIFFGNSLVFTEQGNLRDATTISIKRTDLLKMIADILAKKRQLNQKDADIDLNSPAFMIFQKLCFDRMMQALKQSGLQNQMIRIVLNNFSNLMSDWGKQMKSELLQLRQK